MSNPHSISVIVPTHQRRQRVSALVQGLGRQTFPSDAFEVVVVIDGSADGTQAALEAMSPPHRLRVLSQPQRGRAAAVNAGIAASRGTLLVLLDDDMEPSPEFLAAHWQAHHTRARIGVMGAVPVAIFPRMPPAARFMAEKFNGHLARLGCAECVPLLTDFYSGNFSIRRDVLVDAGGFDEDFQLYGNEDLELSFRLRKVGVSPVYDANARATQYNDKDFPALALDAIAEGRTAVLFALKHPDAFEHLKLGSHGRGPLVSRTVRNGLLRLSQWWTTFPDWVVSGEAVLAWLAPRGVPAFYRLAFGYFYWIGARAALESQRAAGPLRPPLSGLAGDLRL